VCLAFESAALLLLHQLPEATESYAKGTLRITKFNFRRADLTTVMLLA